MKQHVCAKPSNAAALVSNRCGGAALLLWCLQVREPQPLTLHHLPLPHTFAIFEVSWQQSRHQPSAKQAHMDLWSAAEHASAAIFLMVYSIMLHGLWLEQQDTRA